MPARLRRTHDTAARYSVLARLAPLSLSGLGEARACPFVFVSALLTEAQVETPVRPT
jgi:hypothetical protein